MYVQDFSSYINIKFLRVAVLKIMDLSEIGQVLLICVPY